MERDNYDLIREYRSLKTDILYPFDDKKIEDFVTSKNEILEKRKRLDDLKAELDNLTVKNLKQCKNNLLLSIETALELTSNNRLGYPLSRNQGLIISNYVYGKVLGIIESAMNSASGFGYPQFYFEKDGDFDSTKLRSTLREFHDELAGKDFASFQELEEFYEKYESKLRLLWAEENEKHPQPRF
jgi:hypothetical protein